MVLATDMVKHGSSLNNFKNRIKSENFDPYEYDKQDIFDIMLHACDISNPSKPWKYTYEWAERILAEFFQQGDRERQRNLPITYLCDRYDINKAKSQIGFIDYVVLPLYISIETVFPSVKVFIRGLNENKVLWSKEI